MISAQFLLSAASASDFPQTGLPEIAMVGRSNVGKSTLINALVQKAIARTSAAPGKTRLANYYLVQSPIPIPQSPSFYLVDLPGYGYARGGEESAEAFETLTRDYFAVRPHADRRLAGVLHLIDARHPELPQDAAAHLWISALGLPLAVVATKVDKLKQAERVKALRLLDGRYRCPIVPASALKREGIDHLWKTIRGWINPTA